MQLHDVFEDAGYTVRRKVASSKTPAGVLVLGTDGKGYYRTRFAGKKVRVHNILWELRHGPVPDGMWVDHINGDTLNNHDYNHRLVSVAQNRQNSTKQSNNTSGTPGVSWINAKQRWVVRVQANGRVHSGGQFVNYDEAYAAAAKLRAIHHGAYAREVKHGQEGKGSRRQD